MSDDIRKAAETLAGATVRSVVPAKIGGNSQIFCVETAAARFALKVYPTRAGDPRNRADIEWRALQFLTSRGLTTVPKPGARDPVGRFLLMEWVDGVAVTAHRPGEIPQAADFIAEIFALSGDPEAQEFPLASEACLSAAEIVRQIDARLPLLIADPEIDRFLDRTFRPLLAKARTEIHDGGDLPNPLRRLIPADFGFHNTLRQANGRLRYIDFEYFGWDDPVKLTADFLLHPAMQLGSADRRYFTHRMTEALPGDGEFVVRLRRLLPLFALRWMLILLNPFRQDRAKELSAAPGQREALRQNRLAKAQALVEWVAGDATAG
jgi:hypothetical protein